MSDSFFGPPPRRPGRGFWRRLRVILLWGAIGGVGSAAAFAYDVDLWRARADALRLVREGRSIPCKVLSRRSTSGKSPTYYVSIWIDSDKGPYRFERKVWREDWNNVRIGQSMPYFCDPAHVEQGVAQVEQSYRERTGDLILLGLGAAVLAVVTLVKIVRRILQMALLRNGVEVVTRGTGREVRLSFEDRSTTFRPPREAWKHVYVRASMGTGGYVVLASRDLRWAFFPELRDLPVSSLTRDEAIERLLPPPVRAPRSSWKEWMGWRYSGRRSLVNLAIFTTAVVLLIGGIYASVSKEGLGGFLKVSAWAGIPAGIGLIAGLSWLRGLWRDRVLWLEGEEVHGVLLDEKTEKGRTMYFFTYSFNGSEFRRIITLPVTWSAMMAQSPPTAPAVTRRLVLLVDPYRPKRWTLVPERARR